jgi:hypothetical protein
VRNHVAMRAIAAFAALVPLLTLPALADRAAVDKCKADADKTIATLNARMRNGYDVKEGNRLQEKHRQATQKRADCDKKENDPPAR